MAKVKPGDVVAVTCDTTDGRRVTADLEVRAVAQLGCGCQRLELDRPGPKPSAFDQMHALTGCAIGPHEIEAAARRVLALRCAADLDRHAR